MNKNKHSKKGQYQKNQCKIKNQKHAITIPNLKNKLKIKNEQAKFIRNNYDCKCNCL